jgi:tRNA(His) guanylyltransferase
MKQNKDSLGDRMKNNYEMRSQSYLPRRTYTMIRLDGRAFHTYTRGLARPFDNDLMCDMDLTAKFLCENIQGCKFAYVQSDEISLVLTDFDDITTDAWFDGNVQKITSISASMAAAQFNYLRHVRSIGDVISSSLAFFDSRVFVIPEIVEVHNYFVWRQQDATRNSIQMAAQSMFSHKELQGVNCKQLQEKMWSERGVNWNDYPEGFKRGRCVVKNTYMAPALDNERLSTDSKVTRTRWVVEAPPIFTQSPDYIIGKVKPE